MDTEPQISVVIPAFCEAESLEELAERIAAVLEGRSFEVIFVDDGSTDRTPEVLRGLVERMPEVRAITLRRNCGKSIALMAGFSRAGGRAVVTMDADLQDNPEDIPSLLAGLDQGFDLVNGRRQRRHDGIVRTLGSRLFNAAVSRATGLVLHDFNCGFKALRGEVASMLCVYGQYHRYIPLQAHLMGFKVTEAEVRNSARKFGTSKFRAMRYEGLFDLLSMLFIHRYGLNPLHFFGTLALLMIVPSVLILGYLGFDYLLQVLDVGEGHVPLNRPLFSLSLTTLLMGMLVFLSGFICDFTLHHHIRNNMSEILGLVTRTPEKTAAQPDRTHHDA
ncbi:MAG: glycosyltransferase family 2 protein [Alphaproteobacteria bacterium]|nr:glycosyltransferase family 2 protein [Alphaproteobacteria bacterium]MBF0129326.1 glycosyltransferase family 2 protein [Alphaproteobacteria bacterium]